MDERLYEEGIIELITVQEGVIGYTVNRNSGKHYLGMIKKQLQVSTM